MSIKNFGRLALISGLVFGVSAIAPVSVLAEPLAPPTGEQLQDEDNINVTVNPLTFIEWTPGETNSFNIDYGDVSSVNDQSIGSVRYVRNVLGDWNIKAEGTGFLKADNGVATIPYQVKLVTPTADTTNLTPGTTAGYQITSEAGVVLATGEVVDANSGVTDATGDLQIKISEGTRVPAATYIDTVTLVFSEGLN